MATAGRKALEVPTKTVSVQLTDDQVGYLDGVCAELRGRGVVINRSQIIRALVDGLAQSKFEFADHDDRDELLTALSSFS